MKYKVDSFGWHSSPITFEVSVPDLERSHRKYGRTQVLEHYSNASGHQQLLEVHGVDFSLSSSSSSSSSSPISSMGKRIEFSMKEKVKQQYYKIKITVCKKVKEKKIECSIIR
ncbi:hypothetical protein AXF42_Ash015546 [Apostasia shenzhenica]|uniref:Uncharacterized protein n=1 Tax=Apostasia shenzhenica TaxID=1088818 RepID=A0A2I0AKI7_9ASPA|nr:hypothetical protein AXF42_Ash015546 [Apostasia shenzhenica]